MQSILHMVINLIDAVSCKKQGCEHCKKETEQPVCTGKEKETTQTAPEPPGNVDAFQSEQLERSLQTTVYVVTLVFH